jgi:hypothetical protein
MVKLIVKLVYVRAGQEIIKAVKSQVFAVLPTLHVTITFFKVLTS